MNMPHIASRLLNTPLLVHPGKAAAVLAGLGGRITGAGVEFTGAVPLQHVAFPNGPQLGTVGDRLGRSLERSGRKPYDVVNNVAIIPVEGSLVHKGAWIDSNSGDTSYQGIQTQVQAALRDSAVRGVAFEVDSYGGEVSGAYETSDMIAELSKVKPTIAILSDAAYSAGYLLASAARQIVVPEAGGAGSIGTVRLHADLSAALEAEGIKVTILAAGQHKADANSYQPLPEDVASQIQGDLESLRRTFAGRVAQYREGRISFDDAMATEARMYRGAEAVTAGLVDATGHPAETFEAFTKAVNRA